MPDGELTPYQLHGMHPVLTVRDSIATVSNYRDVLGFHVDFVHGDPGHSSFYLWLHVGSGLDRPHGGGR